MGRVLDIDGDDLSENEQHRSHQPVSRDVNTPNHRNDVHNLSADSDDMPHISDENNDEPGYVRLDHFLKLCGAAMTGGHAKLMIQSGEVTVDGEVETRRRRKLKAGQQVGCAGDVFDVG